MKLDNLATGVEVSLQHIQHKYVITHALYENKYVFYDRHENYRCASNLTDQKSRLAIK